MPCNGHSPGVSLGLFMVTNQRHLARENMSMNIKNDYDATVTFGIYNRDDIVHATAFTDGTLSNGSNTVWDPGSDVPEKLTIIFKEGLKQIASASLTKGQSATLTASGNVTIS